MNWQAAEPNTNTAKKGVAAIKGSSTTDTSPADFDVIIIGAGISGIGAAYRIAQRNPGLRYVILERRAQIGGTWDLFRYPGVRCDTSTYTLCFPWEPWTKTEAIADGDQIREYITAAAHKHKIDRHIRFNTHIRSADWDSATHTWTVRADSAAETPTIYRARFLFFGTGYYDYDEGYAPGFPGDEQFSGTIVHPQHWPADLDYTGQTIVVIGSGATAVTMVPSLAMRAAKVTMLQRSPSYLLSLPKVDPGAALARRMLPSRLAHTLTRLRIAVVEVLLWELSRRRPGLVKKILRKAAIDQLPDGYDVDTHFTPRYNPWDQRICIVPNNEFYQAVREGGVGIATGDIDHFDATGIALKSGEHLNADIVVTATGMNMLALGGIAVSIDGTEIKPQERYMYKAQMLEDVPNLAWCIGYAGLSWTLRADMTARSIAKLLAYMNSRQYTSAYPHRGSGIMPGRPLLDLTSGYVTRSAHALPMSGNKRPWKVGQNYLVDAIAHRFSGIGRAMVFGTA
ncbi:flavin-containing monooxygenase [Mycobacterium montefiorense]|uniref:Monooxygenase n=1 Tax=Mycobacterium montefiorense TaxID=154654 RepID=A0AA37PIQ8_9MYCO|nr:NAD(P)/FAD-dependent oxidoreductase [Mycobacterium montefiorense]GBG38410.1 monooxygenase [Mycobacterium montefiorense]GKU34239.1 monooxygenase [Mycobacterium montefiorense]GKU38858.1 monooxygenase [Mycobacterium montefiorense]GKU48106.1 monooxygenase [Mycobacterium montefiorense]GKU49621.1 monooxygenase [Mycobacterium montefiorense]